MGWTKKKSKNFREVIMWCRSERWGDFLAVGFYIKRHSENAERCRIDWDHTFELDYDEQEDKYYVPEGWYVILNTGNVKEVYRLDDGTQVIGWQRVSMEKEENHDLRGQRSDDDSEK